MTQVVFAPVSGPRGMGEYARCLTLACELQRHWPQLRCHFLLSRDAPYASTTPFETHLLPASVTLSGTATARLLLKIQANLVVFDNAGRYTHLLAARQSGARVVYISSRRNQRRKAFQLRWMRLLDEHWLAYPKALFGSLTLIERTKLACLHRPQMQFLDVLLAPRAATDPRALNGRVSRDAVIFVPGGGSSHPGALDLPRRFLDAACKLAASGAAVQFVAGPSFGLPLPQITGLQLLRSPAGGELMGLLADARLVVVNGGDTLLQALVLGKPCLAVPIAPDQAARVRWLQRRELVATSKPEELHESVVRLLADSMAMHSLTEHGKALGWQDCLPATLNRMAALLGLPH